MPPDAPRREQVWEACVARLRDRGATVREEVDWQAGVNTDGFLAIEIRGSSRQYLAEVWVGTEHGATSNRLLSFPHSADRILLMDYATRAMSRMCRERGINYVDTVGNMLIDTGSVLLDVEGRPRKRPGDRSYGRITSAAFTRSGLQVVFALLVDRDLAAVPQRDVARVSGVSLGTVSAVLENLEGNGFYERQRGARRGRVIRAGMLFDLWVEAYPLNLRPALGLGRFSPADPTSWLRNRIDIAQWGGLWGAESAAARLGDSILPGVATAYLPEVTPDLMAGARLVPDATGVVELRRRFWGELQAPPTCVPTPLVYADLVASGGQRERQAAEDLRRNDDLLGSLGHR